MWRKLSLQAKLMVIASSFIVCLIGWISFEEWSGRSYHSNKTIPKEGFWGPVTSNLDWCEENYSVTYWIAELYNSLSSLFICASALLSYFLHLKKYSKISWSFKVLYFNVFMVGFGSVLFHATLKRWTQMLDELPMLFASLSYLYIMNTKNHDHSPLTFCLHFNAAVLATWLEICLPEHPEFLQLVFLGILLYDIYLGFRLVSEGNHNLKANAERGLGISALAAVVWMTEPLICQNYSWLHLHSWWHFLSSLGCFFLIILLQDAYGQTPPRKEINKLV